MSEKFKDAMAVIVALLIITAPFLLVGFIGHTGGKMIGTQEVQKEAVSRGFARFEVDTETRSIEFIWNDDQLTPAREP